MAKTKRIMTKVSIPDNTNLNALSDSVPHSEILNKLLEQLKPVDFQQLAFPETNKLKAEISNLDTEIQELPVGEQRNAKDKERQKLFKRLERMKVSRMVLLVSCIDEITKKAKANKWEMALHNGRIFLYNGIHWEAIEEKVFQQFLGLASRKLGIDKFQSKHYDWRDKLLKQFMAVKVLPSPKIKPDKVLINFPSGTYHVSNSGHKLQKHSPGEFLTYVLPFDFSIGATAPRFRAYLDRVLPDVTAQAVLAEFLGYVFTRNLKLEKALILYGSGANGKSVFFEIVKAILGSKNLSSYGLKELEKENYRAQIGDKLLNFGTEIKGGIESDTFKNLVSGEPIGARFLYQDSFVMEHYAKLAFNANTLPSQVEHNEAYFRRFIIIPFAVTIPEAERNADLAEQIIKDELPGVFNWILEGLNRILKNRKFSKCEAAEKALREFKKQSDSVALFLEDNESGRYEPALEEYVKQDFLFSEYRSFCTSNGFHPVSVRKFVERLEAIGFQTHRRNIGKVVYAKLISWN